MHASDKHRYPFISLHKSKILHIRTGMSSRDLFLANPDNTYSLGICWEDSLAELLTHTKATVYIQEDVYAQYKPMFDHILEQNKDANISIIST